MSEKNLLNRFNFFLMEESAYEFYERANKISRKVFEKVESRIKEGEKLLDLADFVEKKIEKFGGSCAFPPNLSINEIAAHYTPDIDDNTILKRGDLIKVDLGIHINGYISDRAKTYCVGEKSHELIKVAHEALKEALKMIVPGNKVWQVSQVVEEVITSYGYQPVRNLSGHGLGRYQVHVEPSIPNSKNSINYEFKEGQAIAMEVFVTDGVGWVNERKPSLIYSLVSSRLPRDRNERKIVEFVLKNFKTLPFAKRWITFFSPSLRDFYLNRLVRQGILTEYPVLVEKSNGLVAQEEETIIVRS